MAVSCSGLTAGVTCAVAPARRSRTTPVQDLPFHTAAYEPVQTCPSPQENSRIPATHSPAALSARPVMTTDDCPVTGGTGSLVQVVPLNRATWSPAAIQTRPGATVTASSAPILGTLT